MESDTHDCEVHSTVSGTYGHGIAQGYLHPGRDTGIDDYLGFLCGHPPGTAMVARHPNAVYGSLADSVPDGWDEFLFLLPGFCRFVEHCSI